MYCYKDGNECPYKKKCKHYTSDGECYKMCIDFNEIDIMMYNANIPQKYKQPMILYPCCEKDVGSFEILNEIKNNIYELVEQGLSLYIKSKNRQNGKTSWAIKILQNYIHYLVGKSGDRNKALYLYLNEYLRELKLSFDTNNNEFKDIEKKFKNCKLLILDGIDENRLSEYERNYLKIIIKNRMANNLSTIFIGNNDGIDLANIIGHDLKYYIEDNSKVITIYADRGDNQ